MDLRQRRGLIGSKEPEEELYPIGTDLITEYIGRNANGRGLFQIGYFNSANGEITISSSGNKGTSTIFMPVNPKYSYQKTRIAEGTNTGRLYNLGFYDKNYNYIGQFQYDNLNIVNLPAFPSKARYIRIATHVNTNNWTIAIVRTA